jgi:hypothetical protein
LVETALPEFLPAENGDADDVPDEAEEAEDAVGVTSQS